MSVNKVILVGNVGRDPEVRYLDGNSQNGQGTKVATFTLATSEKYRDRNGEMRENTEWHNIVAWRQSADIAEKFIRKGSQIYIEGKLRTRSWVDQAGVKKYTTEINVETLQLLGRRQDEQGGYAPQASYSQQGNRPAAQYGSQQPQYANPQQPSYQAPVQQEQAQMARQNAAAPQPIDISMDDIGSDDLPF